MAIRKAPYGGVYANMDFDALYGAKRYEEYPKHIPMGTQGKFAVANNALEEQKILSRLQIDDDNAPPIIENYVADHDKDVLLSRARELQIPVNAKWSKAKLQSLIESAESTIDELPAEQQGDAIVENEELLSPEELKDKLIADAKTLGIPANKLWGIPRLKQSIKDAKRG